MATKSKLTKKPARASAAAAVVTKLAPQSPDVAKDVKAKPEPRVDQAAVNAWMNAQGQVGETTLALFLAVAAAKVHPDQFIGRKDAKVRASEFNCAYRLAERIGVTGARKVIADAAKKGTDKRAVILAALREANTAAHELKSSALKGAALKAEISKRVETRSAAQVKKEQARTAQRRTPQAPRLPKADSVNAFQPAALALLLDMQKKCAKINAAPAQLAKWKDFVSALNETVDALDALSAK